MLALHFFVSCQAAGNRKVGRAEGVRSTSAATKASHKDDERYKLSEAYSLISVSCCGRGLEPVVPLNS